MAGLRTNALVALGACGFVVFSGLVGQGDPLARGGAHLRDSMSHQAGADDENAVDAHCGRRLPAADTGPSAD